MWIRIVVSIIVIGLFTQSISAQDEDFLYGNFPEDFQWGFATASYQVEGAWDEDG